MKNLLTILPCLIFFLAGCAQKRNDIVTPNSFFPNKMGDQYTYQVTDSVHNVTYNVLIEVGGQSSLTTGKPVTIWTYSYPDNVDTSYVLAGQDSVVFYGNRETSVTKLDITNLYHFPLTLGAKWKVSFAGDTSTVVGITNIAVGGKTYTNAYHIHEYGHSYNYTITKELWYVPNVGMVRMDYKTLGAIETWQLVNYHIN
ncbi:MAG: hypothetical protein JWR54_1035 [Mucilaginibacter sp.]|nr:hypothetical protein [Mucilaginibacter sp.]